MAKSKGKTWSALQPGDVIDVVAPAFACSKMDLNKGVTQLKKMGFQPRLPKQVFSGATIFSSEDEKRWEQFSQALKAKDSKAIWCVRGGFGSLRFVPNMKKMREPANNKLLIGYSDISTLHMALGEFWNWSSLHGPLVDRLGKPEMKQKDLLELKSILLGDLTCVTYSGLNPLNSAARSLKSLRAPVWGGNLLTVASSLGTSLPMSFKGRIAFFEELGERPYKIDRLFEQLVQGGAFKGCRGIVLGDFLIPRGPDQKMYLSDVLPRFVKSVSVPVFSGVPAGHGLQQRPIPMNTMANLYRDKGKFTVNILTGVSTH